MRVLKRRGQGCHFVVDVSILGKGPAGAAIPVARVAHVAFDDVHDTVRPATELGFVLLHDRVRLLPVAFLEIADRGAERHGLEAQPIRYPPSTGRMTPVTNAHAGEQRNTTEPVMSSTSPQRPRGVRARIAPLFWASSRTVAVSGVAIQPGATALTRIPSAA